MKADHHDEPTARRTNAEQQARRVVRDIELALRRDLGIAQLEPDFVAELYMSVLEELRPHFGDDTVPAEEELWSSLALTVYLVAASQQPGVRASTDLIPRLRKVIARSLSGARSDTSADGPGGR